MYIYIYRFMFVCVCIGVYVHVYIYMHIYIYMMVTARVQGFGLESFRTDDDGWYCISLLISCIQLHSSQNRVL